MDGRIAKIEKNVQTALPSDLQIGIMCDLLYLKIISLQYFIHVPISHIHKLLV